MEVEIIKNSMISSFAIPDILFEVIIELFSQKLLENFDQPVVHMSQSSKIIEKSMIFR